MQGSVAAALTSEPYIRTHTQNKHQLFAFPLTPAPHTFVHAVPSLPSSLSSQINQPCLANPQTCSLPENEGKAARGLCRFPRRHAHLENPPTPRATSRFAIVPLRPPRQEPDPPQVQPPVPPGLTPSSLVLSS
ncbi:unnamed protein product [Rangifer tarandus platyrhynchus]|uniref:Uncharacterized protein n=1 Tax=Rangifer tarandus platyrhynchus TaxID=3082113 RepID=A0AC59ZK36_RANTA